MAAVNILTTGNTAATSADIVVASGTPLTVAMKGAVGAAQVSILLKDDNSEYQRISELSLGNPATVLSAAGTYRFSRVAGAICGVFSA